METEILKMWEAMDGPLGVVVVALLAYTAGFLRSTLQELRDAKADAKEDRAEFKAQLDRQRDEANARADRKRDEAKAQSREDRTLYVRDHVQLSNAIADVSKQIAENSKQIVAPSHQVAENSKRIAENSKRIAENSKRIVKPSHQVAGQSKQIVALQGDAQVLLDRSDSSAGGNLGTDRTATRYELARQEVPTPPDEEDGKDEQR